MTSRVPVGMPGCPQHCAAARACITLPFLIFLFGRKDQIARPISIYDGSNERSGPRKCLLGVAF
jgi:hypothetical protein